MQPIHFPKDLPHQAPSSALQILTALHEHSGKIEFTYHGGSDPGQSRKVLPILLFQKIHPETDPHIPHIPNTSPIYLLAHCQTRNAPRTFRLDRIQQSSLSPLI
jgi:predicted DNA-binding transcriptional regulator YafY